ncbi:MAG: cobalamin-dependent protein [Chloroflexota bacterium]
MAKLLLCHPLFLSLNPDEQAASSPYFPLGLLYLAAYVRENGHQVAIFDGTFEADEQAFAERLAAEKPDMVGISALLPTKSMALKLAQLAQEAGVTVVFGGPDPTKNPAAYLDYPHVDIVVHHEGEQTIVALLDLMAANQWTIDQLGQEQGIAFRDGHGKSVVNQPRPPIENLDELPLPARDLIDMDRYLDTWQESNGYASMTIATSRGCPYGCEWCRDAVHGQAFRQRSPESVAAEMQSLKENYQIDRLRVVDDVDGLEREWLEDWAKAAEEAEAVIPFEALNDLERRDIPMLDVRDSL